MGGCTNARERRMRDPSFANTYLVGHGIDVGAGDDTLGGQGWPHMRSCQPWDLPDGDGQYLASVPDEHYDFLHSSHCLEHLVDPHVALANWLRVVKPGGHLVIIVPDEDLYEQGVWPPSFNGDHKWTFTIYKPPGSSWSPRSVNVVDMLHRAGAGVEPLKLELLHERYNWEASSRMDQSSVVECGIEIVLRKRTAHEIAIGGRFGSWWR